jgi:hypothetical protein
LWNCRPQEWESQECVPSSINNNLKAIRWTARHTTTTRPIDEDHHRNNSKPKDRSRPAQPTANRSGFTKVSVPVRRLQSREASVPTERPNLGTPQTAMNRGSQKSLSPHERNQTRDRSNRLHSKNSSAKRTQQVVPTVDGLCMHSTTT